MVDFKDKTSPIYRFLDSSVGRPWNDVRSELFQRFDTRTTPGRHVLFDHLLQDVCESTDPDSPERWHRYFVSEEGLLCRHTWGPWHGTWKKPADLATLIRAAAWLGDKKIGRSGHGFALFVPARKNARVRAVVESYEIVYAVLDETGSPIRDTVRVEQGKYSHTRSTIRISHAAFRQARMLDKDETAFLLSLPEDVREKIFALAPANT